MIELITYIVKNLVKNPNNVELTEVIQGTDIIISIKANEEDLGRIIGKNGKIIQSIRTIAKSVCPVGHKIFVKVGE